MTTSADVIPAQFVTFVTYAAVAVLPAVSSLKLQQCQLQDMSCSLLQLNHPGGITMYVLFIQQSKLVQSMALLRPTEMPHAVRQHSSQQRQQQQQQQQAAINAPGAVTVVTKGAQACQLPSCSSTTCTATSASLNPRCHGHNLTTT
jgi:hypothetical protein